VDLLLVCILAVAGLVFGSFLNVCISRVPHDESVISPGSRCPRCAKPIRWYHNIPVFSFFWLKGRCADCHQPIAFRYPLVELLTAALFVACFAKFGLGLALLKFCLFSFLIMGLIFMDAETGLLPREFTYPGIALGLLFAWYVPGESSGVRSLLPALGIHPDLSLRQMSLLEAILAAVLGAAFFYLIWAIYYLIRRRHGLGFGDIALIAMCGSFLGLKLTLVVLFAAPILGAVYAIVLLVRNAFGQDSSEASRLTTGEMLRSGQVPFGVFLGACSLLAVFWGEIAWSLYLAWAGI
jgi:leader peptidase (prepilin peptidase)/N-methyltransferase